MRFHVFVVIALMSLYCATSAIAGAFTNGDFEFWPSGAVAPPWTSYNQGTNWQFLPSETPDVHSGTYAQKVTRTTSNAANKGGVQQNVTANIGDAFTLADAWSFSASDSTHARVSVRADWAGGMGIVAVDAATILGTATQSALSWYQFTGNPAGNATASSVTFFLDVRLNGSGTQLLHTTWDDVVIYQAFVPNAPVVGGASANSLAVDIDAGGNSANADAEYAVTIGGGAFGLGTSWLQADGTVGLDPVWQTDSAWGNWTVGGLAGGTSYTFKSKARYNGIYVQGTYLGAEGTGMTTIPEPGSMIAILSGLVGLVGFGVRRRK